MQSQGSHAIILLLAVWDLSMDDGVAVPLARFSARRGAIDDAWQERLCVFNGALRACRRAHG